MDDNTESKNVRRVAKYKVWDDPMWCTINWKSHSMDYHFNTLRALIEFADPNTSATTMQVYKEAFWAMQKAGAK